MNDADRLNFVIAAYAIAGVLIVGMIGFVVGDYLRLDAKLRALQGKFGVDEG